MHTVDAEHELLEAKSKAVEVQEFLFNDAKQNYLEGTGDVVDQKLQVGAEANEMGPQHDSEIKGRVPEWFISKAARVAIARIVAAAVSKEDAVCTWGPDPRWKTEAGVAVEQILSTWKLQTQLDAAEAARSLAETTVLERDAIIRKLQADLVAAKAAKSKAEAVLEERETIIEQLSESKSAAEAEILQARSVIEEQDAMIQDLLNEIMEKSAEMDETVVFPRGALSRMAL